MIKIKDIYLLLFSTIFFLILFSACNKSDSYKKEIDSIMNPVEQSNLELSDKLLYSSTEYRQNLSKEALLKQLNKLSETINVSKKDIAVIEPPISCLEYKNAILEWFDLLEDYILNIRILVLNENFDEQLNEMSIEFFPKQKHVLSTKNKCK